MAVSTVALIAMLGIQGCSSDSKNPVALSVTASEPSAGKYAFDVPATLDGGVMKIELKNTGKEAHELQFAHVKDGTTAEQFVKDVLDTGNGPAPPIPDYLLGAGGLGAIAPGATATVTQKFDAGTYVFFCTLGDGEKVHYKNGMLGTTTLKGDKGKGDLPKADASVTARDYAFDISGLKAGSNTVTFENKGGQLHQALFVPLAPGATFDEAKAALLSQGPPTGPPPVQFEKATALAVVQSTGKLVESGFTLEKGTYVVVCFISDKSGGEPHAAKGMIQQLDVS
jgi:plastocyanin